MLLRNCAGGIVFSNDKVLLLRNERDEWTLPKAIIKPNEIPSEVAIKKIKRQIGLDVDVIPDTCGMSYEFEGATKQSSICNKITWYILKYDNDKSKLNSGNVDFFTIDEALDKIRYNNDKSIVNITYKKMKSAI